MAAIAGLDGVFHGVLLGHSGRIPEHRRPLRIGYARHPQHIADGQEFPVSDDRPPTGPSNRVDGPSDGSAGVAASWEADSLWTLRCQGGPACAAYASRQAGGHPSRGGTRGPRGPRGGTKRGDRGARPGRVRSPTVMSVPPPPILRRCSASSRSFLLAPSSLRGLHLDNPCAPAGLAATEERSKNEHHTSPTLATFGVDLAVMVRGRSGPGRSPRSSTLSSDVV